MVDVEVPWRAGEEVCGDEVEKVGPRESWSVTEGGYRDMKWKWWFWF